MRTLTAIARPWAHGWELHVDGVGVTQVRVLHQAQQQVRDLVTTMTGEPSDTDPVDVRIDLGPLTERVTNARQLTQRAAALQAEAAAANRQVVMDLRDAGLSISDIAHVMGVSRGRVSQLVASAPTPAITVEYDHQPKPKAQRKTA